MAAWPSATGSAWATTPEPALPTGVGGLLIENTARGLTDAGIGTAVGAGVGTAVGDGPDTAVVCCALLQPPCRSSHFASGCRQSPRSGTPARRYHRPEGGVSRVAWGIPTEDRRRTAWLTSFEGPIAPTTVSLATLRSEAMSDAVV